MIDLQTENDKMETHIHTLTNILWLVKYSNHIPFVKRWHSVLRHILPVTCYPTSNTARRTCTHFNYELSYLPKVHTLPNLELEQLTLASFYFIIGWPTIIEEKGLRKWKRHGWWGRYHAYLRKLAFLVFASRIPLL